MGSEGVRFYMENVQKSMFFFQRCVCHRCFRVCDVCATDVFVFAMCGHELRGTYTAQQKICDVGPDPNRPHYLGHGNGAAPHRETSADPYKRFLEHSLGFLIRPSHAEISADPSREHL